METNLKACTQKLNSLNLPPEHVQFFLESLTPSLTEVVICGNIFTRDGNMPGDNPPSGSVAVDQSFSHFYSDSRAVSPDIQEAAGGSASPLAPSYTYQAEAERSNETERVNSLQVMTKRACREKCPSLFLCCMSPPPSKVRHSHKISINQDIRSWLLLSLRGILTHLLYLPGM